MSSSAYTYPHPRPILAADSAVFTLRDGALHVLLIERGQPPFVGSWALPGGWVEEEEPVDDAGARELLEETGLANVDLRQLFTIGDPGRDPRGWCATVVYIALIDHREHPVAAGDDAAHAEWCPVNALPALAFDHATVMRVAVERLCTHFAHPGARLVATPQRYTEAELDTLWRDAERFLREGGGGTAP
ncbi:MAG: NUDIX hydrolase [Candidatus Hydrogenedentes bacterium]|nr:NUDIX hydrolase [Candidatus Hydrogenedentota bacterium]